VLKNGIEESTSPVVSNTMSATQTVYGGIRRYATLILFILTCIPVFITAYIYYQHARPQGDEPHYLVISQTMLLYQSIDVVKTYDNMDYWSYYPQRLDPHLSVNAEGKQLPLHGIGGPFLWLIPFALVGRIGAVFFIALISVLMVINIYKLLIAMKIRQGYAFMVSLAFAVGSPIYVYSHLTFIEPIAALCCIYVLRVLCQERLSKWDLIGSSTALGLLPWIHIRFAHIELLLFLFLLFRLYKENRFKNIANYVCYIVPVALLFVLYEVYNVLVWGSLNPAAHEFNANMVPFTYSPFVGLLGIFFDQEFGLFTNFPIFIFALPGILLTLKRQWLSFNVLLLLLFVPYLLMFASFITWAGGWCPPARYIMVLTPTLAFYMAYALQWASSKIINALFGIFTLFAFACGIAYIDAPKHGFNGGHGESLAMQYLQNVLHVSFTKYIPSVFLPQQKRLFAAWILGAAVITLVVWLLAIRSQRKAKVQETEPVVEAT
jgi:hypothetical protein